MIYNQRIGIKEIAKAAGVSSSTVSRVLRGRGEIAEATRERIQEIARELGYRPNLAVRTMQTGKSQIIGILMDVTSDPDFRGAVLKGIHNTLIAADFLPVVIWARPGIEGFSEADQIHRLVDHRVDGLIMAVSDVDDTFLRYIDNLSIPVVAIDRLAPVIKRDKVLTDDNLGGRLAAEHLQALGHRSMAFVGDYDLVNRDPARRAWAFRETLGQWPDVEFRFVRAAQINGGYEESRALLSEANPPGAVFATNDYVAWNVVRAAHSVGMKVPEELSVIGFGNLPHVVQLFPELTTFEQYPERMGVLASERILERVASADDKDIDVYYIEPELVLRKSTAPPHRR